MALNGWKGGMRANNKGDARMPEGPGRAGNGVQSPLAEDVPVDRNQVSPLDETTGANSKVIKTEE